MQTMLTFFTTLGLGGLLGVLLKAMLDSNSKKRELLFNARVKAYSQLMGRVSTFFLDDELPSKLAATRHAKINMELSEAILVGSKELTTKLNAYAASLRKFQKAVAISDMESIEKLHPIISIQSAEVQRQMRRDIFIAKK